MNLQLDLQAVFDWSVRNRLPLNMSKCKVLSLNRQVGHFDTAYKLNNERLQRYSLIKDFGGIFDRTFYFTEHISYVINKAKRKLGFIKRSTMDFIHPMSIVSFFRSMVAHFRIPNLVADHPTRSVCFRTSCPSPIWL